MEKLTSCWSNFVEKGNQIFMPYTLALIWFSVCCISTLTFLLTLFTYFLIWENDWDDFNNQLSGGNFNVAVFAVVILILCSLYVAVIWIYCTRIWKKREEEEKVNIHLVHWFLLLVLFLLCVILLIVLCVIWYQEFGLAMRFSQIAVPFIFLILIFLIVLLTFPVTKFLYSLRSKNPKFALGLSIFLLVITLFIFTIPIWFDSATVISGPVPQKPRIIAHRGAASLAPENTVASMMKAASMDILSLESDVRISADGVPFLMHDSDLQRTTNVAEIFPDRKSHLATTFTISELKQLDAGSWWIKQDPFGSIKKGLISDEDLEYFKTLTVPTLAELLEIAKNGNVSVIFDLIRPQKSHPCFYTYGNITLQVMYESGINDEHILWLKSAGDWDYDQQRYVISQLIPNAIVIEGVEPLQVLDFQTPEYLLSVGVKNINTNFAMSNSRIRDYFAHGFEVNIYTVNKNWLFEHLWCLGVTSITTNYCQTFLEVDSPFCIPLHTYQLVWGILGGLAFGLFIAQLLVIFFLRNRNGGSNESTIRMCDEQQQQKDEIEEGEKESTS